MNTTSMNNRSAILVSAFLVCCSLIALGGIDLVLPAIPHLPEALGGSVAQAQYVLASFAAGTGLGLIFFGELGARFQHRWLLLCSLLTYALMSELAAMSQSIEQLIGVRFFQGLSSACAAVVAPGIIKAMFDQSGALRALGILGSVESLAPAIAPIIGVWLLSQFDWRSSFHLTTILAIALAGCCLALWRLMPVTGSERNSGSYWKLLVHSPFHRYATSQALALGGLLVFVFGAPSVITLSMGGTLSDFILMQICGISTFIFGANMAQKLVARFGTDQTILGGTLLSIAGALSLLAYALLGDNNPTLLWVFFVPFNMGLGFRGPPCFYQALVVSNGDDARASALLILFVMLITATGTVLVAPWVETGLLPLSLAATVIVCLSLLCTLFPNKDLSR